MRVFHFLNEEFGIKDLREKRLKISEMMSLNDPFEFLSVDLSDLIFRKAMKKTKSQLAKTNGLICFSANWKILFNGHITLITIKVFVWGLMLQIIY